MERLNSSYTTNAEETILRTLIPKIPSWITPDLLTLVSVVALFIGGIMYALSTKNLELLWIVNLCLVINWFADGVDGKLAYFRNTPRPNYGYYIDHMLDSFGVIFLLGGLSLSSLITTPAWWFGALTLIAAFVNSYLKATIFNKFDLSVGKFSPTDARIGLILTNLLVLFVGNTSFKLFGLSLTLVDCLGWIFVIGLTLVLVPDVLVTKKLLEKEDSRKLTS